MIEIEGDIVGTMQVRAMPSNALASEANHSSSRQFEDCDGLPTEPYDLILNTYDSCQCG